MQRNFTGRGQNANPIYIRYKNYDTSKLPNTFLLIFTKNIHTYAHLLLDLLKNLHLLQGCKSTAFSFLTRFVFRLALLTSLFAFHTHKYASAS